MMRADGYALCVLVDHRRLAVILERQALAAAPQQAEVVVIGVFSIISTTMCSICGSRSVPAGNDSIGRGLGSRPVPRSLRFSS
jgi:hypothetical protein